MDRSHQQDETDAFADSLLAHRAALFSKAMYLEDNVAAAEDLLSDTIERAFRYASQFKEGTNIKSWLSRIMENLFTDQYRRRRNMRTVEWAEYMDVSAPVEPPPAAPWDLLGIEDVKRACFDLSEPMKQVAVLIYVERLQYRDVAARLAIPNATVGTRLLRARKKLRARLLVVAQARLAAAGIDAGPARSGKHTTQEHPRQEQARSAELGPPLG